MEVIESKINLIHWITEINDPIIDTEVSFI